MTPKVTPIWYTGRVSPDLKMALRGKAEEEARKALQERDRINEEKATLLRQVRGLEVYIYIYIYLYVYIYIYIHIFIYTHIFMYTYMCIYIHIFI